MISATPQIDVLRYLSEHGEQQTFRVARILNCGTPRARALLDRLQRRGLIEGSRFFGRPILWRLTDNGRSLVAELRA